MLKIEEEARHLKIQILEVNLNQLQKRSSDSVRKRDKSYNLEL